MFAIIQSLGHQYKVTPGSFVRLEKLPVEKGATWQTKVLALQDDKGKLHIGKPFVEKTTVIAEVRRHGKSKKVLVFKKNRRKGYRRTQGHRQDFTEIYVQQIKTGSGVIKAKSKQKED